MKRIASMADAQVYSASNEVKANLPRDRFISGLALDVKAVYDTGSEVTEAEDAVAKMVGGLKADSSIGTFLDIAHVQLLYWWAWQRSKGTLLQEAFVDTASQTDLTKHLVLPIYFNPVAWEPFGRLAGLPLARGVSEAALKIQYPANTVGGTGVTHDATFQTRAAIYGYQPGPMSGFAKPKFVEESYSMEVKTGLGMKLNMPTGGYIRRTLLMQTNTSTGAREDTNLTELAIQLPKIQKQSPLELEWWSAKALSAISPIAGGNVPAQGVPTGIVMIDWCDWLDAEDPNVSPLSRIYGLDMTEQEVGNIQLAFTVGTAHTMRVFHEQYLIGK